MHVPPVGGANADSHVRRLMRPLAGPLQVNIAQPGSQQLNAQLPPVVETDTPPPHSGSLRVGVVRRRINAVPGGGGGWVGAQSITPPKRFHKGRFGHAAR